MVCQVLRVIFYESTVIVVVNLGNYQSYQNLLQFKNRSFA